MMVIDNKYNISDKVYLVTDEDQYLRLITGIKFDINGFVYIVQKGSAFESEHYEFELSLEKNVVLTTTN